VTLVLLSGCGGGVSNWPGTGVSSTPGGGDGATASAAEPPSNPLRFTGGQVTISAEVAALPGEVESVYAEVTKPDNSKENVTLVKASDQTYQGTWNIPPNTSVDGKELAYTVAVTAKRKDGRDLTVLNAQFSSVKDPTGKDVTGVTWPTIRVPAAFTDDIPSAPAFP